MSGFCRKAGTQRIDNDHCFNQCDQSALHLHSSSEADSALHRLPDATRDAEDASTPGLHPDLHRERDHDQLPYPQPGGCRLALASSPALAMSGAPLLPSERSIGTLEPVARFEGAMPTSVAVSETGRIFVNFPRWGDEVVYSVAEWRDGRAVPYPDARINRKDGPDPAAHFISVQSVVADGQGRLWVLDTAAPGFSAPQAGGAKLVAIDLATNTVAKTLVFPANVIDARTYVNDVRFDFRVGREGVAYVTDSSLSGIGGIIVIDLATGVASKRLVGHVSTSADAAFVPIVEGQQMRLRNADGSSAPFTVAADGIALSPDGGTLFYTPLSSRHLYSVPTALLRDPKLSEAELAAAVVDLGDKGASDGMEMDANGRLYASDYEHNAIHARDAQGRWTTVVHDPRIGSARH